MLFQQEQEYLQKRAGAAPLPVPQRIFEIKLLLAGSQPFLQAMTDIGEELTQSDSSLLAINKSLYLRNLLYNEQKFNALMSQVTQRYSDIVNDKNGEESTIDMGKFVLLIIAIICLIILVLEPAFKRGKRIIKNCRRPETNY